MTERPATWRLWREALASRMVWRRSLIIGLVIGSIQIAVNQGDVWFRLQISSVLILKTLVTPMIATSVALFSSAGAYVELKRQRLLLVEPGNVSPGTTILSGG